nr:MULTISPECIES: hypothetical protein [Halorubrum]
MTSTVLDVTVLLLCVSASVVALGASDAVGPDGPTATDAADRLVTETTTVSYPDEGAPNETRRIHATRAELLALLAARDAETAFDRRAVESVRAGVGPRTRVDATVKAVAETDRNDAIGTETDGGTWRLPSPPAVRGGAASRPASVAGGAVPAPEIGDRGRADGPSDTRKSFAIGPEPPRNADIAVAVVRHPVPDRFDGEGGERRSSVNFVRVIVRRW